LPNTSINDYSEMQTFLT